VKAIFVAPFVLAVIALSAIVNGWTLTVLWRWFVEPLSGCGMRWSGGRRSATREEEPVREFTVRVEKVRVR
jgi:hypothetical protein